MLISNRLINIFSETAKKVQIFRQISACFYFKCQRRCAHDTYNLRFSIYLYYFASIL